MLYPSELESDDRDFFVFDRHESDADIFAGMLIGLVLSIPLWTVIGALIWAVL